VSSVKKSWARVVRTASSASRSAAVEDRDAVAPAGGPPAGQPVPKGEPPQRVERSREHVDAGEFDGLPRRASVQRRGQSAVPELAEDAPQPVLDVAPMASVVG
jgi:hypothetical protein